MKALLIYSTYKYSLVREVTYIANEIKPYVYFGCMFHDNTIDLVDIDAECLSRFHSFIRQYNLRRNNTSCEGVISTALVLIPIVNSKDVINKIMYTSTLLDKVAVSNIKTLERFIHKHI